MRMSLKALLLGMFAVSAALAQTPDVKPDTASIEGLIGDTVTFSITFDNTATNATGYGPFIDLVLEAGGADLTSAQGPCDGITFVSAVVSNTAPPLPIAPIQFAPALPCLGGPASPVAHPFAGVPPVAVPNGGQLVVLPLQFGSFDATQAPVTITVTVRIHKFADDGVPLHVFARGGFRYGTDAVDNPATDKPILGPQVIQTITPRPWIVRKTLIAPEGETVSGPNFVYSFALTVDVAPEQEVKNLTIHDCASTPGLIFKAMSSMKPAGTVVTPPFPPSPPNCFDAAIASASGPPATTNPAVELRPAFWLKDDPPVVHGACVVELANTIQANATWIPLDPRDPTTSAPHDVPLAKDDTVKWPRKAVAVQKTATPVASPGPLPGSFIDYTLDFQISDYLRFGSIVVYDWLSDGQTLFGPVRFRVRDRFGSLGAGYTLVNLPSTALGSMAPVTGTFKCGDTALKLNGATRLAFSVSKAMSGLATSAFPPTYKYGVLTGGEALGTGGGPAIGQIVYRVQVTDKYIYGPQSSTDDRYLDKHDPLLNAASIQGCVVNNVDALPPKCTGQTCQDETFSCLTIPGDKLEKRVIAQNGTFLSPLPNPIPPPPLPLFAQSDTITFSLKKTIPTGDGETITLEDWLPLPAIRVTTPASKTLLPPCANAATIPGVNAACYLSTKPLNSPSYFANAGTNSLRFTLGTLQNNLNTPVTIEIRFTLPVSDAPMADQLHLTNEAQECERNSFGAKFCQNAVAQLVVSEPRLRIRKAVLCASPGCPPASDSLCGPPGSCPRIAGTLHSGNIDQILGNPNAAVDANDRIAYAVAIENVGSHPAFDIVVFDSFAVGPATFVPGSLCVRRGDGAPVPTTGSFNGPGAFGFEFVSLPAFSSTSGANIILITFDLQVKKQTEVTYGECSTNDASLAKYSNHPKGPNFIEAGQYVNTKASASACIASKLVDKKIEATSEKHTEETSPRPLAIGEIIRYTLTADVPEGQTSSFRVVDGLPAGLTYLGQPSISTSGAPIVWTGSPIPPSLATSGNQQSVTFDFGAMANLQQNDPACETITISFNALVLNDDALNPDGAEKWNSFEVFAGTKSIGKSPAVKAVVVRPLITAKKEASPPVIAAGGTINYLITYTNSGSATAFDVVLNDPPPAGLKFVGTPAILTLKPDGCAEIKSNTVNTLTGARSVVLESMNAGCKITAALVAQPLQNKCPAAPFHNVATIVYTSLPGAFGTTLNATGSQTPGTSGAPNGELNKTVTVVADTPCVTPDPRFTVVKVGATKQGRFIHYEITITNNAAVPAYNVSVYDTPGSGYIDCAREPGGERFIAVPPKANGPVGSITQSIGAVTNYQANIAMIGPGVTVTLGYDGVAWDVLFGDGKGCFFVPCSTLINTVVVKWSYTQNDPNPPFAAIASDPLCTHF